MNLNQDANDSESLWQQMTSLLEGRSSSGTPLRNDPAVSSLDNPETASYQDDDEHLAFLRNEQDQNELQRQEEDRSLTTKNDALAIMGRINVLTSNYIRLEATLSELVERNRELGEDWNYYSNDSQDEVSGLRQKQDISLEMEAIRNEGLRTQSLMKKILTELQSYGVQIPKKGGRRKKTKGRMNRKKKKTKRRN